MVCNSVTDIFHESGQLNGWDAQRICPQTHAGDTVLPAQTGSL